MIEFINIENQIPFIQFKKIYEQALRKGQKKIQAACISTYSKKNKEVSSRYVNLKYLNNKDFIFFTNYNSQKAQDIDDHKQISVVLYWNSIDVQVRMKAIIKKTSLKYNDAYFRNRDHKKNALSISSDQSNKIISYESIIKKYDDVLNSEILDKCPMHWGGFSFRPYSFEFWTGHKYRVNKRDLYEFKNKRWKHYILEP